MQPTIYDDGSYLSANASWHEEDAPYKARLVADVLKRHNVSFATCAEVGCGSGAIIDELASQFPSAAFTGYDIAKDAERFWSHRKAPNTRYVRDDILKTVETFDLLLCLDVFEHVDDYIGFLRELRSKASKFLFKIPLDMCAVKLVTNGIRAARQNSGHLHYFNQYTAIETLRYAGYAIEHSELDASFLSVPPRNIRQAVVLAPRLLMSLASHKIGAALMGGYTLIVMAS